ncbi:MAG: type II toxin-antitoxin system HicA family toxin [Ignavibacteriota bacterium]
MARLSPLPFREIKRRLEAAGFAEAGQRGSHVKFVRRSGDIVDTAVVPKKHEVPVGTLRSILSQDHIGPAEGSLSVNGPEDLTAELPRPNATAPAGSRRIFSAVEFWLSQVARSFSPESL